MQRCAILVISFLLSTPVIAAESPKTVEPENTPFRVDVRGLPSDEPPVVTPWRKVRVDAEYGGKFVLAGDVDGDREVEIVAAKNVNVRDDHYTSAVSVQNLDGSTLWRWGDPTIGRRDLHHDVACQIHDIDADGKPEVIVAADREVVVLEGATGKVKSRFPIPKNASDCVTFADLKGAGHRGEILVKTRYTQIWAYTAGGKLLWTVEKPGGYRTAHQPFPVDLDGDGREEILAGYAALNADGSVRWVFELQDGKKNGGHADCWRVVRIAEDPKDTRLIMTMCSGNALVMTDGAGKLKWKQTGHHYESVDAGDIRPDVPRQGTRRRRRPSPCPRKTALRLLRRRKAPRPLHHRSHAAPRPPRLGRRRHPRDRLRPNPAAVRRQRQPRRHLRNPRG